MKDILVAYRNYLFSLQAREEFGDKYGDTEDLLKMYEKKLGFTLREIKIEKENKK